jgi:hypothetical protein
MTHTTADSTTTYVPTYKRDWLKNLKVLQSREAGMSWLSAYDRRAAVAYEQEPYHPTDVFTDTNHFVSTVSEYTCAGGQLIVKTYMPNEDTGYASIAKLTKYKDFDPRSGVTKEGGKAFSACMRAANEMEGRRSSVGTKQRKHTSWRGFFSGLCGSTQ